MSFSFQQYKRELQDEEMEELKRDEKRTEDREDYIDEMMEREELDCPENDRIDSPL